MTEQRPDAALDQPVETAVAVIRRRVVVEPVEQRRHARVELVQRADQRAEADVLGCEARRHAAVQVLEILLKAPVAGDAADAGLPGVEVGVDQARHDDHAAAVDDLAVLGAEIGIEIGADGGDRAVLDQHVAVGDDADVRVHRHHPAVSDQCLGHRSPLRSTPKPARPTPYCNTPRAILEARLAPHPLACVVRVVMVDDPPAGPVRAAMNDQETG